MEDSDFKKHYDAARRFSVDDSWDWEVTAEVLWRAFCMSWVTVAWAMLVGKE